jgi:hypothetical protein
MDWSGHLMVNGYPILVRECKGAFGGSLWEASFEIKKTARIIL